MIISNIIQSKYIVLCSRIMNCHAAVENNYEKSILGLGWQTGVYMIYIKQLICLQKCMISNHPSVYAAAWVSYMFMTRIHCHSFHVP